VAYARDDWLLLKAHMFEIGMSLFNYNQSMNFYKFQAAVQQTVVDDRGSSNDPTNNIIEQGM